jgi:hypothetical protein
MALSDTRAFLEELVLRYDPSADVTEGARAQTELIEPILERVGIDPFDEDIEVFVRERVRTAFPDLAITEADDLTDVLIDPIRVLFEPLVREVKLVKLRSSLRNISSLSDDEVDALMGNFFSSRISGGFAVGVVRAYFSTPQTVSVTQTQPATTRSGLRFFATRPQQITSDQMLLNIDGSEYYFDINYTAENRGSEYNVEANEVVSIANLPSATRVRNIRRFRGGTARESSADFSARTQRSLSDKTLTVERGITSTLYENFPALRQLLVVGFRDAEMTRDVIKGGSLGPVPADDTYGSFFGTGTPSDDLDADNTTPIVVAPSGNFVARLGAVGSSSRNWYMTLVYNDGPTLVVVDAQILEVLAADRVRTDHEIPLPTVPSLTWMLRERKLTLTDIPGGITLPDTAANTLEIRSDEVHIGGKTDVYVAGETEQSTATITNLTDASPISRGFSAETQGSTVGQEAVVLLNDITNIGDVVAGMSLVLEEGTDAGAYLIIEVLTAPSRVRLDTGMTGTQSNLSFRVIDDIDVELTDPKALKVDGADLITSAGSGIVQTASATNFIDVNVQAGDILEITDALGGGEFTVEEVSATSLVVTPVLPRTIAAAPYQVYTRSEAVNTPVVRVRSIELLDSSGAPTGTTIPYRDPVLALSQGFQNEGSGFPFDNLVLTGLLSLSEPPGGFAVAANQTLVFTIHDPDRRWDTLLSVVVTHVITGPGPLTAAALAAQINANVTFAAQGLRAVVLSYLGSSWVGFVCERLVTASGGTAYAAVFGPLVLTDPQKSNADVAPLFSDDTFISSKIGPRDIIEFVTGNNAGNAARVLTIPSSSSDGRVTVGRGPLGPEGTSGLYNNFPLRPDVGARARAGRASVGSVRVLFPSPTSADFDYLTTRFSAVSGSSTLVYGPDPENTRTILPPYPRTDLIGTGTSSSPLYELQDGAQDFLLDRVQPGDVLQLLYQPITGSVVLPSAGNVAVVGLALVLRLDTDPYITISFPFDMPRQQVADYINTRVGVEIASINGTGNLALQGSRKIEIDAPSSTSLVTFGISTFTTDHPDKGEYIITGVSATTLTVSLLTPMPSGLTTADSYYRIFRYTQRASSTEMNSNLDASGLYYADVEAVSAAPGDIYNLVAGAALGTVNHRADGYRLTTDNEATSFSRAEVLRANISPSILLVGSSDSPREYVQLAQQNVQIAYDRSQLTDDIQSFCDSDFQRVVCEEILARHLTPHYVSLNWAYVSGASEPEMVRAVSEFLDALEPDVELEVGDVVDVLRKRGATSVYTPDSSVSAGRIAPFFVLVYHDVDRQVRAQIVRDYVDTVRTQRFISDTITLRRISPGGIR